MNEEIKGKEAETAEEKKEIEKAIEKIEQKIEEKIEEIKENGKEAKKEKFCPKCNSKNIKTDFGVPETKGLFGKFGAIGGPYDYVCEDCKFRSKIFPEIEIEKIEEKEQEKNQKTEEKIEGELKKD